MAEIAKVILLYGKAGLGKTVACAELVKSPAVSGVLFSDIDGGLQAIRKPDGTLPDKVFSGGFISTPAECKAEWDRLRVRKDVPETADVLVIDSLTALEQMIVAHLADHMTSPWSTGEMNIPKWGKRAMLILDYVRLARSLPFKYVIFTAHQDTERDGDTTTAITPLAGSARTQEQVSALCAHVIHFGMAMNGKRQLILDAKGIIAAKCRSAAAIAASNGGVTDKPLHELIGLL